MSSETPTAMSSPWTSFRRSTRKRLTPCPTSLRRSFGHLINDSRLNRTKLSSEKRDLRIPLFSFVGSLLCFRRRIFCQPYQFNATSMLRSFLVILLCISICACSVASGAPTGSGPTLNSMVLEAVQAMPHEGGFTATPATARALSEAVSISSRGLQVDTARATPSYCSSATYLVFLTVCERLLQ